ncbi:putative siderophore transport system permease protein YfhA [Carnimonas sp. R-84981]|uniref:FecCD family ABC transporter permease n=1 Tax=Carnimonas bestiolae TaxID=3402172 RepID=UPI003EDBB04B
MLIAALVIGLGLLLVAVMAGNRFIPANQVWAVLVGQAARIPTVMVWDLRLPRSLAALFGGAGLALSGWVLQRLCRNPLAGPGMTGVTAGTVFPIVCCFVLLPRLSSFWYPPIGVIGGVAAAMLSWWIARQGRYGRAQLVLAGMCVSLWLSALTTWVILRHGADSPTLLFWLAGGFQGRSWMQLLFLLPWVLSSLVCILLCHRVLDLLGTSDEVAVGAGLDIRRWKPLLLVLAVVPVAAVSSIAGPVALVGLIAPHITRLLRPSSSVVACLLCALVGGVVLMGADLLARTIAIPREVPIGFLTALLGAPMLLWLIQSSRILRAG